MYLDQVFSDEQKKSIEKFHDESKYLVDPHDEIVLFDDYNIKRLITSHEEVIKELDQLGAMPKYYAFEKDMIGYVSQFIESITTPKIKRQYEVYIEKYNKYPCSLLTAVWYLVRLGHIRDSLHIIKSLDGTEFTPADSLINFLPGYFAEVESKAQKLIKASAFSHAASQIKNIYFEAENTVHMKDKVLE